MSSGVLELNKATLLNGKMLEGEVMKIEAGELERLGSRGRREMARNGGKREKGEKSFPPFFLDSLLLSHSPTPPRRLQPQSFSGSSS